MKTTTKPKSQILLLIRVGYLNGTFHSTSSCAGMTIFQQSSDEDLADMTEKVLGSLLPDYAQDWETVLNNVSPEVRQFVANRCRQNQVTSEMRLLPILAMIASITGNRITCDYGDGKLTNLCVQMILVTPTNSRKSKIHSWINDELCEFADSMRRSNE
jgi:hypothetical protein